MTTETRSLYSQLPAIDRLLRDSSFLSLRDTYGHTRVVELLRQMLDEAREAFATLESLCDEFKALGKAVRAVADAKHTRPPARALVSVETLRDFLRRAEKHGQRELLDYV